MARVLGIGGVFFKCRDREALAEWYREHLGLPVNERGGVEFEIDQLPESAYCVWGPFAETTGYFAPSGKQFMINLVVDDLEEALAQVAGAGAEVVGEVEEYEYGRFGWFVDPEGNKIELWEPAGRPPP